MNTLYLNLNTFFADAYTHLVIIKGHEIWRLTLFVDPQTCKACFQALYNDNGETMEHNSEPESDLFDILNNECTEIKSNFDFFDINPIVRDVFYKVKIKAQKQVFIDNFREMDFSVCFMILE